VNVYSIIGALVGLLVAAAGLVLLRSQWSKPDYPSGQRKLAKFAAAFGLVFLPTAGWYICGDLFGEVS